VQNALAWIFHKLSLCYILEWSRVLIKRTAGAFGAVVPAQGPLL
jgi:hypothetical protein